VSIAREIRITPKRSKAAQTKKTAGRVTGSQGLPTQGRTGQAKGNIKQAGAKIKDAFRHGLSGDSTRDGR